MAEAAGLTVDALREKLGLKADPVEVKQEFSIVGAISPETVAEIVETGKAASKGK
ncbi:hypothetical protein [Sphingopyxis fribergensis]|nr:hypothetical protein [Sphingopyxis fribergensis]